MTHIPDPVTRQHPARRRGQSLAELVFTIPVLLIILVGAFYVGWAMYEGHMAADAIKRPTLQKMTMANTPGAVGPGQIMGWATGATGNLSDGALDSVNFVHVDDRTSILVGQKAYTAGPLGITFDFSVNQAIQRKLLEPAGGSAVPATWFPTPDRGLGPPTSFDPHLANMPRIKCGPDEMRFWNADQIWTSGPGNGNTFQARDREWMRETAFANRDTMTLSFNHSELPPNPGGGNDVPGLTCATYQDNLTYKPDGPVVNLPTATFEADNPWGAPGVHMKIVARCANSPPGPCDPVEVTPTYNEEFPPPHPLYWDPSGAYRNPPGNFIPTCAQRQRAYDMIDAASALSWDVVGTYNMECDETIP